MSMECEEASGCRDMLKDCFAFDGHRSTHQIFPELQLQLPCLRTRQDFYSTFPWLSIKALRPKLAVFFTAMTITLAFLQEPL